MDSYIIKNDWFEITYSFQLNGKIIFIIFFKDFKSKCVCSLNVIELFKTTESEPKFFFFYFFYIT